MMTRLWTCVVLASILKVLLKDPTTAFLEQSGNEVLRKN